MNRAGESANSPSSRRFTQSLIVLFSFFISPLLNGAEFYNDWATNHLSSLPSQSGPTNDPDADFVANLAEYAFGTDPLVGAGLGNLILPGLSGEDGVFAVELFERAGHRPGLQIDMQATADMTHWIQPWWLRTTNSLPGDPAGSVREQFTTYLPTSDTFIVRAKTTLVEAGPETANYYVATNGNDTTGNGSISQPYATLAKAVGLANSGNLIYMHGGTYPTSGKVSLSRSGVASQPIRVRAFPGEQPIFDCSSAPSNTVCLSISGSYWYLCGLVITNAGSNAIYISGNNNTVERCVSYGARNTGIHISGGQGTGTYPSNNLVLNCDVIRSFDAIEHGEDADGFSAKWNLGSNNVFRGCRSWENSDDGWDLWMGNGPVLIENCWAFRNGSNVWHDVGFTGNGNGFKLGGGYIGASHRLVGCLAFQNVGNGGNGIDQNNNALGQTVDQNTAWANRARNFNLRHGTNTTPHVVRNNVSMAGGSADTFTNTTILVSNSWQLITSPAVGTNDFLSLDTTWATAPRRDDGGLPEIPFLRPVPGGRLVDKGADLGAPFSGSAPDLGAYETLVW
jgi:hypothetical protein